MELNNHLMLNNINRETVKNDYNSASNKNLEQFLLGNTKATSEYIYPNQILDAENIINIFYNTCVRALSIIKRTKVGMDGLMIEIASKISMHNDDNFMLNRNNIFIITAMSNLDWEENMKDKIPNCFKENIFHHGKLQKLKNKLIGIKNALIINDEIDTGDKEGQKLHIVLKNSGILDIDYMKENNIKFIFVSATMINELKELYKWGDKHYCYKMTIPDNYISHSDFLNFGIIKEFFKIDIDDKAIKWIQEDIINNYDQDYRVHIIRTDNENNDIINKACIDLGIIFYNHTSKDKISWNDLEKIFSNLYNHVVIAVKGFYRRANLIPNEWKLKIGAIHERYCVNFDTNVQIQGLVGRMTGYWKNNIILGHKTGPYRTSINSVIQYEEFYKNPFNNTEYNTNLNKEIFLRSKNFNIKQTNIENITNDKNKHIPIIINFNEDHEIYYLNTKNQKIEFIKKIISKEKNKNNFDKLFNFISNTNVRCIGFITPETIKSYKMHITDLINASKKKIPYSINLNSELKKYNNWQCFIDCKKNNLCVLIWTIDENLYLD